MIHWRKEGEHIHYGLSVYHPKDEKSIGFLIRVWGFVFRVRYSKKVNKLFIGYSWLI